MDDGIQKHVENSQNRLKLERRGLKTLTKFIVHFAHGYIHFIKVCNVLINENSYDTCS